MTNINSKVKVKYFKYNLTNRFTHRFSTGSSPKCLFDLLKEDCIYEHETALGCWKLEGKTTIKKTKIIYFVYTIPLLIAWDCV